MASGAPPERRKNTCEATYIDTDSAAVLNAIWLGRFRRWIENNRHDAAIVSVPAAGPNSSVVLMKNVSSMAMFADTDLKCSRKQPASIVTAVSISQAVGRGMRAAANADCASTTPPAATTVWR